MRLAEGAEVPRWKRPLDFVLIVATAPVWLPLGLACALWIRLVSPGPLFYRQVRVGLHGRKFEILKFRSMKPGSASVLHEHHVDRVMQSGPLTKLDAEDDRLIPGGRWLRAAGLDEIPQILNILRGEMSVVGPRPCTPHEASRYRFSKRRRFEVLPGVSGLWQVNGKNRTTFRRMVACDLCYVRRQSVWMDLGTVLRIIPAILGQVILHARERGKGRHVDRSTTAVALLSGPKGDPPD